MFDKRLQKGFMCRSVKNALTVFRVLEDEEVNCYEKGLIAVVITAVNGAIWLVDKRLNKGLNCRRYNALTVNLR